MSKVLIVIGDAAEVTDTLYPYFRVQEDGFEAVVAAPEKRTYHLVMHDTHPDWDITIESPWIIRRPEALQVHPSIAIPESDRDHVNCPESDGISAVTSHCRPLAGTLR